MPQLLFFRGFQRDPPPAPSIELAGLDYLALDPVIHDVWTDVQPMSELLYRELVRPLEAGCFNSIPVTDPFDHFKRERFASRT